MRFAPVVLAAALAASLLPAVPASAAHGSDIVSGRIGCVEDGRSTGLAGVSVQLLQTKPELEWMPEEILSALPDEARYNRVAAGFADASGGFRLTDRSEGGQYRIRVVLRDRRGNHVRDYWALNDWQTDTVPFTRIAGRNRTQPTIVLGGSTTPKCAIFRAMTRSHARLERITGRTEPAVEIKTDAITAGVPFTNFDTINYPTGFRSTAVAHEHGHVIRQTADGDYAHFLSDVTRFGYTRFHETCLRTNEGFAFNEGWAEFFGGGIGTSNPCPSSAGAANVEGVVASTLANRAAACLPDATANQRLAAMIATLRGSRGVIHSVNTFNTIFGPCASPPGARLVTEPTGNGPSGNGPTGNEPTGNEPTGRVEISSAAGKSISATAAAARYATARTRVLNERKTALAAIARLNRTYVRGEAAIGVTALQLRVRLLDYAAASLGRFDTAAEVTAHRALTPETKLSVRGCGVHGIKSCPKPVRCASSGPFGVGCVAGVPAAVRDAYVSGLGSMLAVLGKQPATAGVRSLLASLTSVRKAYLAAKPVPGSPDIFMVTVAPTALGSIERLAG